MLQKLVFPNTPGLTSILFNITKKESKIQNFFYRIKIQPCAKINRYVMGDDDSLFFVDNIVDVLSKYDHTEKRYIGMFSESTKSNFRLAFEMAYGGGGYALSYPLVEALVAKLDECIEKYHFIWAGDKLQSYCLADLGADLIPEKGFHQVCQQYQLSITRLISFLICLKEYEVLYGT